MLVKCPECELQLSDKALACPHCGYPVAPEMKKRLSRSKKDHKRLPNGFGQITKLNNPYLRKPFRAMVTVGKTSLGRPISRILKPEGYFTTYNEAYEALIEYNRNPYDLDDSITVLQLYEKWIVEYSKKLKSKSAPRTITAAWNKCSQVYTMRAKDLRARHIKACMDQDEISACTKQRIKSLFNLMLDYALEYEIVDRNYARTFNVSDEVLKEVETMKRGHIPFTEEEMTKLWNNLDYPYVRLVLIQCYMGWRPQELGLIKIEDVDFENWFIQGGMKTKAGTNRKVPIHTKIREMVKKEQELSISRGSEYLFSCFDSKNGENDLFLTYDKYNYRFEKIRDDLKLNPDHRAHDPRCQFITMCKKYNVDEYCIKRMAGHKIEDITEATYTTRDLDWYHSELSKVL